MLYILKDKIPILCADPIEWAEFFENIKNRRVKFTELKTVCISTVFLGIDQGLGLSSIPLIFESMVFPRSSTDDLECIRTNTWKQAEIMHDKLVTKYQLKEN